VNTKRVQNIEQLQLYSNVLAFGKENKSVHWKFQIKNGDEVGNASFKDGQIKVVEGNLADIIRKALTLEESRADDWTEVFKRLARILSTLRQREYVMDSKIAIVGLRIDK
jgi:hypothetical protein